MRKEIIELHNKCVEKGMQKSNFVSQIWAGYSYKFNIRERNMGYVLYDIQKWLRDQHRINLYCEPDVYDSDVWYYKTNTHIIRVSDNCDSYEEALKEGLKEVLKLIQ